MTVECVRASVAYTIAFAFLVSINFVLQGCGNGSPSAFMNGECKDWCEDDQYRVENGKSHKARHCGAGDMADHCGGCPYCGGSNQDDGGDPDNGKNDGDADCCGHCAGYPYCSPKSGFCHHEKPWDKDYYLDCGGTNHDSKDDSSGSCCERLGVHSQENGACIAVRDHKVMMISAHPYPNWKPDYSWDLPGGTNHAHESGNLPSECTCEAAERETLEEANIKVKAVKTTRNGGIFICEYLSDDNSLKSPETIDQQKWYTWEEFQSLTLRDAWGSNYRDLVEDALK